MPGYDYSSYIDPATNGNTPLHFAARGGYSEAITAMLQGFSQTQQMELLGAVNNFNDTPLHIAARGGHSEAITAMLQGLSAENKTIAVNQQTNTALKFTPLHTAADNNNLEAAVVLLENGADATRRCNLPSGKFKTFIQGKGATAADLARNKAYVELAQLLQETKHMQKPAPTWADYVTSHFPSGRNTTNERSA